MFVLHRKMIVHLLRTWSVLFLAAGLAKAEVTLENGSYRNLLVSFSPNLPNDEGEVLLHSMQELLENTSKVLHTAVGVRIAKVTFLLPDSWDVSGWDPVPEVGTSSASLDDSDVLVENVEDSAFGKVPLAQQFGGCGVPGSLITLPTDFLKTPEDSFPKGKLLAREWLKYRYGVFDENGFPGDSLYPTHYFIPGNDEEVIITDCTDPQVEYIFKDPEGNNCSLTESSIDNCTIIPGEISSENVTSSLMYFHKELTKMEYVCGKEHLHNNLSPSKQNVLCGEKSIWNILEQSSDFKKPATTKEQPYEKPEFHYVTKRKPKVALLFESTDHLNDKKAELLFAMRRFVYELPEGSHLSIDTFMTNGAISQLRQMSELTSNDKGNIAPAFEFEAPSEGVCPLCALEKTVDDLLAADSKEASIILIVGSNSVREDNSALVEKLKNSQLCLKVIALKEVEGYNDDSLSQLPCQSFEQIPIEDDKVKTFNTLYEAMMTILPHRYTESPTSVVTSGLISKENEILIEANPTAKDFTIWFDRVILETNIHCSDAEGDVVPAKPELTSNLGIYSFESQNRDVKCNLNFGNTPATLTQVQMKTKPGEFITVRTWIHNPTQLTADSKQQDPVIIYARVNFGSYPVSDARVTVRVTQPDGNVGDAFELHDNGRGDPDITKDDGVYSRYFFNFNKEGNFLVSVEVTDDAGMAKALKKGEYRCCGSEVKTEQKDDVPTFSVNSEAKFDAISARPEQGYPPSKIIDLRVEKYEPPTLLELKWTAPGGEMDTGKAFGYVLKVFCDSETHCQPDGSLPGWISINGSNPVPKEAGQDETVLLLITEGAPTNSTVRIAVESVRHNLNSGLSNRVRVQLVESDIIEEPTTITPTPEGRTELPVRVGTIVGGTVVGVLVLFCIAVVVWFLINRARQRPKEDKSGLDTVCTERSDSFKGGKIRPPVMRRVESFPVILYTHDQIKDVRDKTKVKEPPLFRADIAPKPWVSLGELKQGVDKDYDGSASTVRLNDDKGEVEMSQLNYGASLDSELQNVGKVAKF